MSRGALDRSPGRHRRGHGPAGTARGPQQVHVHGASPHRRRRLLLVQPPVDEAARPRLLVSRLTHLLLRGSDLGLVGATSRSRSNSCTLHRYEKTRHPSPADRQPRRDRHPHRRAPPPIWASRRSPFITADDAASPARRPVPTRPRRCPAAACRGYLDAEALVAAARASGCDAVHPGYGFLAENADFARRCIEAGLTLRRPDVRRCWSCSATRSPPGRSRPSAACRCCPAPSSPTTVDDARRFFAELPAGAAMVIKAVAGGGGRGMRVVRARGGLEDAFARCASEARGRLRHAELYVERLLERARHVEVQILGDGPARSAICGSGNARCSGATRSSSRSRRARACCPAVRDGTWSTPPSRWRPMPATTTSAPWSFWSTTRDPSSASCSSKPTPACRWSTRSPRRSPASTWCAPSSELAAGATLAELGLTGDSVPAPRGRAMQLRVNMETHAAKTACARPAGRHPAALRGAHRPRRAGRHATATPATRRTRAFDSLLAKVIVHDGPHDEALRLGC